MHLIGLKSILLNILESLNNTGQKESREVTGTLSVSSDNVFLIIEN